MIDIIDILKTKAELINWIPVIGAKDIQSYSLSQKDLTTGKSALLIDLPTITPAIEAGKWSEHRYDMELMLVRKFEEHTTSSVKETTEQKYNARLYELLEDLDNFLYSVLCGGSISVNTITYNFVMNVLSKSVDGIICRVTFEA